MFYQIASATTSILVSTDRAIRGTVKAIDTWQDWSDRNFGQAQEVTLGVIELMAYFAGVCAAFAWLGAQWSGTVLLLCGIGELSQFVTGSPIPDLGDELEGEQIIASIERHIPAIAQSITTPTATLTLEAESVNYAEMSVPALRKECTAASIKWRNTHGKNRHMKKGEMIAALTK